MDDDTINSLLQQIGSEDPKVRIDAINKLGDSGDELCLKELRERLKDMHQEYLALVVAVGKLKRSLGIK